MTLQIPTLLALLGAALLTVAIFAPKRPAAFAPVAYAAPTSTVVERWAPRVEPAAHEAPPWVMPDEPLLCEPPAWPTLVDPRAAACDAAARLDLVDALAEVRAPWADAILRHALDDERDSTVLDALRRALAS